MLGTLILLAALASTPSPLHDAVQHNDAEALRAALHHHTDLEVRFEDRTPLALAAGSAAPEILELLLDAGADVNALGPGNTTPLMRAAYYGNALAVSLLLNHHADLRMEADSGYAAFDYALESGQEGIMQTLIQSYLSISTNTAEKHSLKLISAVIADDISRVNQLLGDNHANHHNLTGYAPLPLAVRLRRSSIVELLLSRGANPNIGNDGNDEAGPLHQAARGGHADLAKRLLSAGALVDKPNARGYTPLILATLYEKPEIIRILMEHGADPLRTNDEDQSALSIATDSGDDAMVALLMEDSEFTEDLPD